MEESNETRETEEVPSNELDDYLSQFVLAARTKPRKEYEPSSLRGILSSHECHLSRANYGKCILSFRKASSRKSCRDALKAKQKKLKRHGYGRRLRTTTAITDEETDILFDKQLLGVSSPH